jgi:hypothetical protein
MAGFCTFLAELCKMRSFSYLQPLTNRKIEKIGKLSPSRPGEAAQLYRIKLLHRCLTKAFLRGSQDLVLWYRSSCRLTLAARTRVVFPPCERSFLKKIKNSANFRVFASNSLRF